MKIQQIVLGLVFVFAMSLSATAQVAPKSKNQKKRIVQGVKSGELNKKETVQLARQQKRIKKAKKRAAADGVVTRREQARVRKAKKRASRNIYRKKHN